MTLLSSATRAAPRSSTFRTLSKRRSEASFWKTPIKDHLFRKMCIHRAVAAGVQQSAARSRGSVPNLQKQVCYAPWTSRHLPMAARHPLARSAADGCLSRARMLALSTVAATTASSTAHGVCSAPRAVLPSTLGRPDGCFGQPVCWPAAREHRRGSFASLIFRHFFIFLRLLAKSVFANSEIIDGCACGLGSWASQHRVRARFARRERFGRSLRARTRRNSII